MAPHDEPIPKKKKGKKKPTNNNNEQSKADPSEDAVLMALTT